MIINFSISQGLAKYWFADFSRTPVWSEALRTVFSSSFCQQMALYCFQSLCFLCLFIPPSSSLTHSSANICHKNGCCYKRSRTMTCFPFRTARRKGGNRFSWLKAQYRWLFSLLTHFRRTLDFLMSRVWYSPVPAQQAALFYPYCFAYGLLWCPPLPHLNLESESGMSRSWVVVQWTWALLCEIPWVDKQLQSSELVLPEHCS